MFGVNYQNHYEYFTSNNLFKWSSLKYLFRLITFFSFYIHLNDIWCNKHIRCIVIHCCNASLCTYISCDLVWWMRITISKNINKNCESHKNIFYEKCHIPRKGTKITCLMAKEFSSILLHSIGDLTSMLVLY